MKTPRICRTALIGAGLAMIALLSTEARARSAGADPARGQATVNACDGIPAAWREGSVLSERPILGVRELAARVGKQMWWKTQGAEVLVAAQPGDSAPWLNRVIRCQIASAVAEGHMDQGPLAVTGAQFTVTDAGDAFAVRITASQPAQAREILKRASQFAPTRR